MAQHQHDNANAKPAAMDSQQHPHSPQEQGAPAQNPQELLQHQKIAKLHKTIDRLEERIALLRQKLPRRVVRVAGSLWHLNTLLRKDEENLATPSVDARGALKRAERFCYDAGLIEDEAERVLYSVDAIDSLGNEEIRRHRKALVLRLKKTMKKAARLAAETQITRCLRKAMTRYEEKLRQRKNSEQQVKAAHTDKLSDTMEVDGSLEKNTGVNGHDVKNEDADVSSSDESDDSEAECADDMETTPARPADAHEEPPVHLDNEEENHEDPLSQTPAKSRSPSPPQKRKVAQSGRRQQSKRVSPSWEPEFIQRVNSRTGCVHLLAELPGVSSKDLHVTINSEEDTLTVAGHSKARGPFKRELRVSDDFDLDDTRANFEDGVLRITFVPKRRRSFRPTMYRTADPFEAMFRRQRRSNPFGSFGYGHPLMGW